MFKQGGLVLKKKQNNNNNKKQVGDLEVDGAVAETLVGGSGVYIEIDPSLPNTP